MSKKPVIMVNVVKRGHDDRSFDRKFWKKVGPEGIFSAMWDMVCDRYKWRGHGKQPRFRRSVAVLKRREG